MRLSSYLCIYIHLSRLQQHGDYVQTPQLSSMVEARIPIILLGDTMNGREGRRETEVAKDRIEEMWCLMSTYLILS